MRPTDRHEQKSNTHEADLANRFFQQFRQGSKDSVSCSRYWRLLAQKGWRPQREEAVSILANVKTPDEKRMAAQALFLLTGDGRLLEGGMNKIPAISLHKLMPADDQPDSSVPVGSRTEATMVFMKMHHAAFQGFIQQYLNISPGSIAKNLSWRQLSRNSQKLNVDEWPSYHGIIDFIDIAQPDKPFQFCFTPDLQGQVLYRPKQNRFYIATEFSTEEMNRHLFHKLLQQWLIFQSEFWYCHFLSAQEMVHMLRLSANQSLTLNLSPDWFPRCYQELQSFQNPTHFEFLQEHKNPFLLKVEDIRLFKQLLEEQVLDKQVKITADLLGMAESLLGINMKGFEETDHSSTVPLPIPLRHLLHVAARLSFAENLAVG
ncbi:MAG: hypothetical protein ACOH5I_11535 [Oligoflexus sp.]